MINSTVNVNGSRTLDQWNQELVVTLIPVSIILVIFMILGTMGNGTVLFIYHRKFQTYTEGRFFIPILAVADLVACFVNCACHLSETILPVMYISNIGCKINRYLCMVTTATSINLLLLIAVFRYFKICKHSHRQQYLKWQKVSVIVIILTVSIISLPCFVFFGSAEVISENGELTGYRCTGISGGKPKFALAFNVLLLVLVVSVMVVMSILYFLICRVIFTKTHSEVKTNKLTVDSRVHVVVDNENKTDSLSTVMSTCITACDQETQKRQTGSRKPEPSPKRKVGKSRITVIFIVITIAFAISFIPKLAMMVLESRKADFWITLSENELAIYMFLYSIYIFNNFINPFIFGFLDKRFQSELKKLCPCTK